MPHHLIVDRSYVHGTPTLEVQRCITLNSGDDGRRRLVARRLPQQPRRLAGACSAYNGAGPFKIENNHLEAGHEVVMFGGGDPTIRDLVPSDIEMRRNHITRPLAWKKQVAGEEPASRRRTCVACSIEGNVIENNWSDAQNGFAFVLKSENQSGRAPWTTSSDVTIRNNHIRNTGSGFNLSALRQQLARRTCPARASSSRTTSSRR